MISLNAHSQAVLGPLIVALQWTWGLSLKVSSLLQGRPCPDFPAITQICLWGANPNCWRLILLDPRKATQQSLPTICQVQAHCFLLSNSQHWGHTYGILEKACSALIKQQKWFIFRELQWIQSGLHFVQLILCKVWVSHVFWRMALLSSWYTRSDLDQETFLKVKNYQWNSFYLFKSVASQSTEGLRRWLVSTIYFNKLIRIFEKAHTLQHLRCINVSRHFSNSFPWVTHFNLRKLQEVDTNSHPFCAWKTEAWTYEEICTVYG